ncbi:hypothetical protein D9M72_438100 [compost metagenome]
MHCKCVQLAGLSGEDLGDGFEAEAKFAKQANPLQPEQLLLGVISVAVLPGVSGIQDTQLVIVPEGAGRDVAQPRNLGNGPDAGLLLLHASIVKVDVASKSTLVAVNRGSA